MKNLITLSLGLVGVSAVEVTNAVIPTDPETWATISRLVIQIVIGVGTLIGLFRKKSDSK